MFNVCVYECIACSSYNQLTVLSVKFYLTAGKYLKNERFSSQGELCGQQNICVHLPLHDLMLEKLYYQLQPSGLLFNGRSHLIQLL